MWSEGTDDISQNRTYFKRKSKLYLNNHFFMKDYKDKDFFFLQHNMQHNRPQQNQDMKMIFRLKCKDDGYKG